jgi:hypothetical protein
MVHIANRNIETRALRLVRPSLPIKIKIFVSTSRWDISHIRRVSRHHYVDDL